MIGFFLLTIINGLAVTNELNIKDTVVLKATQSSSSDGAGLDGQ